MVCSAKDGLELLQNSGLRHLALDDYWIEKRDSVDELLAPQLTAQSQSVTGGPLA